MLNSKNDLIDFFFPLRNTWRKWIHSQLPLSPLCFYSLICISSSLFSTVWPDTFVVEIFKIPIPHYFPLPPPPATTFPFFCSIITNKASGGDGIPDELFQILNNDVVKVSHSICQQIWKT